MPCTPFRKEHNGQTLYECLEKTMCCQRLMQHKRPCLKLTIRDDTQSTVPRASLYYVLYPICLFIIEKTLHRMFSWIPQGNTPYPAFMLRIVTNEIVEF